MTFWQIIGIIATTTGCLGFLLVLVANIVEGWMDRWDKPR